MHNAGTRTCRVTHTNTDRPMLRSSSFLLLKSPRPATFHIKQIFDLSLPPIPRGSGYQIPYSIRNYVKIKLLLECGSFDWLMG
jgi:hypothetical protein